MYNNKYEIRKKQETHKKAADNTTRVHNKMTCFSCALLADLSARLHLKSLMESYDDTLTILC